MSSTGALFTDLLGAITDRGRSLIGRKPVQDDQIPRASDLIERCEALLSGRGEASGTAMADRVLQRYAALGVDEKSLFFHALLEQFGPDSARLGALARAWLAAPSDRAASDLHFCSEPRRQELLRRLNRAPGGHGCACRHARRSRGRIESGQDARAGRSRFLAPAVVVVQSRFPRFAGDRLVDAGDRAGKDHPLRSGA